MGVNTLRPRQNGRHFADDIFKCIFLNENIWIPIKISLKFVPKGPINNIPALVQIMAWPCLGDKPLSEPMMISLTTHICVTRPQWVKPWLVNTLIYGRCGCNLILVKDSLSISLEISLRWMPQDLTDDMSTLAQVILLLLLLLLLLPRPMLTQIYIAIWSR